MKCIKCGRRKSVQEIGHRTYRCGFCGTLFDDEPDEGGDYATDPARRMIREEERRERQLERFGRLRGNA